jgi:membrane-associated phospholipid phosphatase
MLVARAAALALLAAAPALSPARAEAPEPIHYDLRVDIPVTTAAAAIWIGTELAKDHLAPATCRWCAGNALDDHVRDALIWQDRNAAKRASDGVAFALIPVAALGQDLLAARAAGDTRAAAVDGLVVLQAVALAADVNQIVKLSVGRQRPFVRFGDDPSRAPTSDDNLSFYSGHTSLAFSFVAATATVAQLRGYRTAPWVWAIGLPLAAAAGYFRIAGDMHYLTDVLAGAAVGTAMGVAVPRLLHGREPAASDPAAPRLTVAPFPLGVSGTF